MATKTITRYRSHPRAKQHHRKASMTIPVAALAGFAPLAIEAVGAWKAGGPANMASRVLIKTTGYNTQDGKWYGAQMMEGLGPIVLGLMVHKYIGGKMGINRQLARSGIPLLRL